MIPRRFLPKNYRRSLTYLAAGILIAAVTLYLVLPIVALFLRMTPDLFFATLHDPDVASALWLSLFTTGISLTVVILVGTPFAYFHSRVPRTWEKWLWIRSSICLWSFPRQ